MAAKAFLSYYDMESAVCKLPDQEIGQIYRAMYRYSKDGEILADLSPGAAILFEVLRSQIDRDMERYRKTSEARAKAGKKGGCAKAENAARKDSQYISEMMQYTPFLQSQAE